MTSPEMEATWSVGFDSLVKVQILSGKAALNATSREAPFSILLTNAVVFKQINQLTFSHMLVFLGFGVLPLFMYFHHNPSHNTLLILFGEHLCNPGQMTDVQLLFLFLFLLLNGNQTKWYLVSQLLWRLAAARSGHNPAKINLRFWQGSKSFMGFMDTKPKSKWGIFPFPQWLNARADTCRENNHLCGFLSQQPRCALRSKHHWWRCLSRVAHCD